MESTKENAKKKKTRLSLSAFTIIILMIYSVQKNRPEDRELGKSGRPWQLFHPKMPDL